MKPILSLIKSQINVYSEIFQTNKPYWDIVMEELETKMEEKKYVQTSKTRTEHVQKALDEFCSKDIIHIISEYDQHPMDIVIRQLNDSVIIVHQQLLGIQSNWNFEFNYHVEIEPIRRYKKRHPKATLHYLPRSATILMDLLHHNKKMARIDFFLGKIIYNCRVNIQRDNFDFFYDDDINCYSLQ